MPSINGGAYTFAPATVKNGDQIAVQQTASPNPNVKTTALLKVGAFAAPFDVTTILGEAVQLKVKSSEDYETAEEIVSLGWPAIEPYLDSMAGWSIDENWPVAQVFAPYLASLGSKAVSAIKRQLDWLIKDKHYLEAFFLLSSVVAKWDAKVIVEMQDDLLRICELK